MAVIGAGSWGTALAGLLGENGHEVVLWARNKRLADELNQTRENTAYLPGVLLPSSVIVTNDLKQAIAGARFIFVVTPSHAVRETAVALNEMLTGEKIIVSAAKGLELGTFKRMSEVIAEELPAYAETIAVLSGPNHAEEVGRRHPTASVVAATSQEVAELVQDLLMNPFFRVYTNPDVIGVELGGALKNIIALGAGIAEGLGFGDNAKAALMTRGLAEIARLGMAMGAKPLTFAGLAGVGDLMVTCTSRHSRNRRAGIMVAQGKSVQQIQAETNMVVEGIRSTLAAYKLAQRYKIVMPITEQTYRILYEGKPPREAVLELMTRGKTHEIEEVAVSCGTLWQK
ncbi:NAD(P)H-dependent glycerol-3-phosphate dehydrogenase [Thermosinus carboxydivorans]|uniref:NAD(P)H-dependent glycerol-3-phosphate dehydrogenase n=1 Tax=Thermosinus carboxydivorans TaxID=261685 RepID=UPI0022B5BDE4|nr:NAD(P)H-dependent glycerol-3-phosphate dehydrogenase [Thermosinus carboxydivorans]